MKSLTTDKEVLHTSFKTLHIGLCSDEETIQLINEEGEHILQIESYPLKGNAELICKAAIPASLFEHSSIAINNATLKTI